MSQAIVGIIVFFMLLAAVDRISGGRFGLGKMFDDGFHAMGPLALAMVGIICLAPLLGNFLASTVGLFFKLFGADPVMSSNILLAIDTGGYAIAHSMTADRDLANFSAIFLGSMMGPTLSGIPIALGIIQKQDTRFLALGTLSGIIVIPVACVIGGFLAGYPAAMVLVNMLPILVISLLIAFGLAWFPRFMVKGFMVFSRILVAVITASLALAILKELTGITVVPGMAPLADSFIIIGKIVIVLAGAYPMVFLIGKAAKKPIARLARKMGTSEVALTGFIAASANSIPMFSLIKDMDDRGKVLNFSFNCCAAYALGDHIGFSAGTEPDLIFPMVAAKLAGGILCILTAQVLLKIQEKRQQRQAAPQRP